MSWDLFVQDWGGFNSLKEIPDDLEPTPIGNKSEIIAKIKNVEPTATFSNPSWSLLENRLFSIEFNMGEEELMHSFAMHVRGSNLAIPCIGNILSELKLKAADGSTAYFFDIERARSEMDKWLAYRDQITNM